jgi:hypothetical protein
VHSARRVCQKNIPTRRSRPALAKRLECGRFSAAFPPPTYRLQIAVFAKTFHQFKIAALFCWTLVSIEPSVES